MLLEWKVGKTQGGVQKLYTYKNCIGKNCLIRVILDRCAFFCLHKNAFWGIILFPLTAQQVANG